MSILDMKKHICAAYNNAPGWCKKVYKMPDAQVVAVYHKLLRTKKL